MVVMLLWLVWSINGELVGVKGPSPLNVAEVPGLNHANRSLTPRRRLLYFPDKRENVDSAVSSSIVLTIARLFSVPLMSRTIP